jgi:hypothetical protein
MDRSVVVILELAERDEKRNTPLMRDNLDRQPPRPGVVVASASSAVRRVCINQQRYRPTAYTRADLCPDCRAQGRGGNDAFQRFAHWPSPMGLAEFSTGLLNPP